MAALRSILAFVLGFVALHSQVAAQCPMPDRLDGGPCCAITTPMLPKFPNYTQNSLNICWQFCNVSQVLPVTARWKKVNTFIVPPPPTNCAEETWSLEIFGPAGTLAWSGRFRIVYSRTWLEAPGGPGNIQVWRWLVNGDLRPTAAAGPIPCPVPPCAPATGNVVRFTGYIDWAMNCAVIPPMFQEAWMISHVCDMIDHAPGFPRAGVFHPDRSYTFVGPGAGFIPGPLQPVEGTPGSPFEDIRRRQFPVPGTTGPVLCEYEEQINFSLLPINQLCLCGPAAAVPQWLIANLTVAGVCGTTITTPGGPFLPGFLSMGIGAWTIPGTYPGMENLRWNAGSYDYTDPCIGTVRREVYYGVTTIGGYPATQLLSTGVGAPLPPTFIDQGNSITPFGATIMNVPYTTDHILNLNH